MHYIFNAKEINKNIVHKAVHKFKQHVQIMKQLQLKLNHILEDLQDYETNNEIMQQINRLMPNESLNTNQDQTLK